MVSFYLKARNVKSEIGASFFVTFLTFWLFLEFRRPYPTLLSKLAGIYSCQNPVLSLFLVTFWIPDPGGFGTSLGVDFEKLYGKPDYAHREVRKT